MTTSSKYVYRTASAALALIAGLALTGCGGGSMFGTSSGTDSSPSLTSRFGQLFASNSQEASTSASPSTQAADNSELSCPSVAIRSGASTYAVGLPGKQAVGNDVRYQAVINRTARDCTVRNGQMVARIGIQGRVIVGPAGAPASVDVPLRVAVVQEGGSGDKVIFTKAYRTTVEMTPDSSNPEYSLVAEDITYPVPAAAVADSYVFYVGFDPASLKPEPAARGKKKR